MSRTITIDQCPELLAFWDFDKNADVLPSDLTVGSNKEIWWKCKNGHDWLNSPHRMKNNKGCPYCSGGRILPGFNDMLTINPDLNDEWDYDANKGIDPHTIGPNSNIKVAWICKKGHRWKAAVSHRNRGKGCPYCSGGRILPGFNDLLTINPDLKDEWDYDANKGIDPHTIGPNSNIKVAWICKKGHHWRAVVSQRNRGVGCPVCSNKLIIPGVNDFATTHPELLAEWNYKKNTGLLPDSVPPSGAKRFGGFARKDMSIKPL